MMPEMPIIGDRQRLWLLRIAQSQAIEFKNKMMASDIDPGQGYL
jgi:hypothetical protein